MAKFTDYTEKTEPVDTDLALIYDTPAKVNKKFTFGNLWKWIAKKIVSEGISQLETTNKTIPGAINELNSKKVFNNLLIYRTSGADIKSVTISINKEGCNDISYAPFALFGGSTFSTGTIGKIDNTLKTGNVTIKCNDNGSIQNADLIY